MKKSAASPKGMLIDELESALAHGNVTYRVDSLRRITDLFVARAPDYSEDQIAVFDDVLTLLVQELEIASLILLARRLAPIPNAPSRTVRLLAFNEREDVASPVLTHSTRLDEATLAENARTMGQGHLLAISQRLSLSPALTDILVERGNTRVVHSTAGNPGARFSENGYARLVDRCDGDDELIAIVGSRDNIPRHHFLRLLAKASHDVRARLEARHPTMRSDIGDLVEESASTVQRDTALCSTTCNAARDHVKELHEHNQLNEQRIGEFIQALKFEETTAALALLAGLSPELAESLMIESRAEGVMVIAKVCGFSWPTVEGILRMRNTLAGLNVQDIDLCKASYLRLRLSTAQQVLRFHRMRMATRATISGEATPAHQ